MDINRVDYGVRYSGFTPSYEFLDATVTARVSEIADLVPGNSEWLVDWTRDWRSNMDYVEGPAFSGQYFVLTEGAEPTLLTNARPGFDDDTIHPVVEFSYAAADGLRIPTLLTIPRHSIDAVRNLPAVMLPHGGPAAHDSIGFDWFAQALADEGYLVIQPQFRGSTGFGLDHRAAGKGEWGRKMQSDLSDGIAALVEKGYVDPARVCIVGMSYGGYAALAGGAFQPDLWRCVVSINGVADLNRMVDHDAFWTTTAG
jgi:dipeptidyl aminopeptidase/acylaminoacyl peptidase